MKAVILAGGLGTRISEETDTKPKPMVAIGGYPVLWHIMKIYSSFGINDFIICCGYKGYVIKEYFANYSLHRRDDRFAKPRYPGVAELRGAVESDARRYGPGDDDGRPAQARTGISRRRIFLLHLRRWRQRCRHRQRDQIPRIPGSACNGGRGSSARPLWRDRHGRKPRHGVSRKAGRRR